MARNTVSKDKNSINLDVQIVLFEEEGIWVAYCPSLQISSYGDDQEDAKQAFDENIRIFLKETERKGTLEKYLLSLGWQLQKKPKPVYNPPTLSLRDGKKLLARQNSRIYSERVALPA